MTTEKPRLSADPLYVLIREGRVDEFNRRKAAGDRCDLRNCNFRGLDLRELEPAGLDLSGAYLRQADLRGLDLSKARLEGASLHAAHISGVLFPPELEPAEIEMSVRLGTRMRYRRG
jgi:uncharacterized protein YjbI with pentapeptide repeats